MKPWDEGLPTTEASWYRFVRYRLMLSIEHYEIELAGMRDEVDKLDAHLAALSEDK